MWHTVLITLHALTGTIALAAGCFALWRGQLYATYLWSLVASIGFLVLAIAEEWGTLGWGARGPFLAFAALGGVMVWLAATARRTPSPGYLDKIGFTLIALFDAFVVIAVLNAGAPVWAVVGSGVAVAVAGHFVLRAIKRVRPSAGRPARRTVAGAGRR